MHSWEKTYCVPGTLDVSSCGLPTVLGGKRLSHQERQQLSEGHKALCRATGLPWVPTKSGGGLIAVANQRTVFRQQRERPPSMDEDILDCTHIVEAEIFKFGGVRLTGKGFAKFRN